MHCSRLGTQLCTLLYTQHCMTKTNSLGVSHARSIKRTNCAGRVVVLVPASAADTRRLQLGERSQS